MRVALYVSSGMVNGVAVHVFNLAKYLLGRGHRVLLLHRHGAWIGTQPGLERAEVVATSFARRPAELTRLARIVDAFDPDVIHTHQSSAHSYGAIARLFTDIPVVATAHVPHFQLHWRMNHIVIATSQAVADYNRRYNLVPRRMLRVVPNFIEIARFSDVQADERRAVRAELGMPADAFVVGSIAHVAAYKRPDDLVRAFAAVAAVRPQARLLIVGVELDAGDAVRAAIAEFGLAGRCVLTGYRADAARMLAAMDVFALASGRESGPVAVLEAMARHLPVVATSVGMVPEFVLDGTTGHLVDVGDTAAMGRHFVALAEDETRRKALGAAGRAHVERTYSVEAVCPRVEAVLEEASAIHHRPLLGFLARKFR